MTECITLWDVLKWATVGGVVLTLCWTIEWAAIQRGKGPWR